MDSFAPRQTARSVARRAVGREPVQERWLERAPLVLPVTRGLCAHSIALLPAEKWTSSCGTGLAAGWRLLGCPETLRLLGCPETLRLLGCPETLRLLGCPATLRLLGVRLFGCPVTLRLLGVRLLGDSEDAWSETAWSETARLPGDTETAWSETAWLSGNSETAWSEPESQYCHSLKV